MKTDYKHPVEYYCLQEIKNALGQPGSFTVLETSMFINDDQSGVFVAFETTDNDGKTVKDSAICKLGVNKDVLKEFGLEAYKIRTVGQSPFEIMVYLRTTEIAFGSGKTAEPKYNQELDEFRFKYDKYYRKNLSGVVKDITPDGNILYEKVTQPAT